MKKSKLVLLVLITFSLTLFLSGCGPTNQPPDASFNANPTSGEAPLEVSFDASNSSDSDGSIISYNWDFGDNYSGSGQTVTNTYDSSRNYTVELEVIDNDGATDTTSQSVDVSPPPSNPPTASFTADPTSGEAPLEVSFDASGSYDSNGNITSYDWSFGDGTTGSGETVNHTYDSSANYTAELTVTDNDGASDSNTKTISVSSSDNGNGADKLQILNWELQEGSLGDAKIVGEVKNVSGEEIDSATVAAKFFDAGGKRLEISYDYFSDLGAGVTANLEIISLTDYGNVDHVDVYVDSVYIW